MKFTTRFRPTDIVAAILIAFVGMMFTSVVNAESEFSCSGERQVEHEWTPPTHRTDDSEMSESEIAGYKIYYGNTEGTYPDSVYIPKELAKDVPGTDNDKYYVVGMKPKTTCYSVITTHDTGGRESKQSAVVVKGKPAPAPVSDLTIVRDGTSNDEYVFSFTEVDTDTNGDPLTPTVYYLFNAETGKWIMNIHYSKVPFILTLPPGINKFNIETEGMINGVRKVSELSDTVTIDVTDYVEPPVIKPPAVIEVYVVKDAPTIIKIIPQ